MARFTQPTPELEAGWNEWVRSRPDNIRAVAERFDPWSLYRLKSPGHRVTIFSFGEVEDSDAVTLTVAVSSEYNLVAFSRRVFGINPDDLEPCEMPAPNERLGELLLAAEVDEHLDELRVAARPDLFRMGRDGKAVRIK